MSLSSVHRSAPSFAGQVSAGFVLAGLVAACSAELPPAADDHEHERPTVQATVHEQGYELFVEYDVPVAGEPVVFVTHVSDTATAEPRRAGPVTFRLRSEEGAETSLESPAPARDGIYLPEVAFPAAGTWTVTVEVPADPGTLDSGTSGPAAERTAAVVLPPVTVYRSEHEAEHAEPAPEPEGIAFLKEQQWRLGTFMEPLAQRPLTERVSAPAVVRVAPERRAEVAPPVAGRFEAASERPPRLGDVIAAGALLGHVRPAFTDHSARLQEARADVVRTKLAADLADRVLDRTEQLVERRVRSEREQEQARFDAEIAHEEYRAAQAVDAALRTTGAVFGPDGSALFELRAPIAGTVREVRAVTGAYVGVEDGLFEIRDDSVVHVVAHVRPEWLPDVALDGGTLFVRPRGPADESSAGTLAVEGARLVLVGDEIEPHNLTVPVVFEVPNPSGLLHFGELVEVQFQTAETRPGLAVPVSALVEEEGRPVIFVQTAGETFEKRHPELGIRDGDLVEVVSGLAEGEWVVTRGAYAIRLAAAAGSVPAHSHAH